jgi:hypothetical protein
VLTQPSVYWAVISCIYTIRDLAIKAKGLLFQFNAQHIPTLNVSEPV